MASLPVLIFFFLKKRGSHQSQVIKAHLHQWLISHFLKKCCLSSSYTSKLSLNDLILMKLKVEISLIKLSDLEGFRRPWIQEGGPFERSSGFFWFDPKSRAIWQLICILGGYRPIDTTRSLFRFPCKDSNNAPPLEKKRRLTLNKENSTSFVEIVCRLFNFCLVTSVSKFKFNGLFF